MSDQEKFEEFKQKLIDENEGKLGKEIREQYGEEILKRSYQKLKNLTPEQFVTLEKMSKDMNEALKKAFESGDPAGELAQEACEKHKQWLMYYWDNYSKEAHMAMVNDYIEDKRFTAYYDKIAPGCAKFLRDAMKIYTGIQA